VDEVEQLTTGRITEQSVVAPDLKLTVPVAAAGMPPTERITLLPYELEAGLAEAVSCETVAVSVAVAGSPSSEENLATAESDPDAPEATEAGMVTLGSEVPAAIAAEGV